MNKQPCVPGVRVHTAEEMKKALEYAQRIPGPHLIEAVIPLNPMSQSLESSPSNVLAPASVNS
jgi:thiamine pyrophosphate-dependent acetolactate synthase large subunit-like protein